MAMKKAILLLEKKDMEGKGNQLIKAQDIILELLYALDQKMLDRGDELALNLRRLYLYAYRRLVHANLHLDPEAVRGVIEIMAGLQEAWEGAVASELPEEVVPSENLTLTG